MVRHSGDQQTYKRQRFPGRLDRRIASKNWASPRLLQIVIRILSPNLGLGERIDRISTYFLARLGPKRPTQ